MSYVVYWIVAFVAALGGFWSLFTNSVNSYVACGLALLCFGVFWWAFNRACQEYDSRGL